MLVLRVKEVTFHKPDLFSPTPDSEAEGSQVHSATELMRLVSQHSGGKWVSVALGLQTEFAEFQDSQGYTEKPCVCTRIISAKCVWCYTYNPRTQEAEAEGLLQI